MKVVFLLCALLTQAFAFAAENDLSMAQQAAASNDYVLARSLYEKLAAKDPINAEYQIWIGRLSGYLGEFEPALEAYDAALVLTPKDVDAVVGKAYVLLWQHDYSQAETYLNRAQEMAPESADVNVAKARLYLYLHQPIRALSFVNRVLETDPVNSEALSVKDALLTPDSIRLSFDVARDQLPYGSSGTSGSFEAGWVSALNQVSLRLEDWDRYGKTTYRAGLKVSHTFRYLWIVEGSTLIGSRGDVLARLDNGVSVKRKVRSRWVVGGQYRDLSFDSTHVRLAGPQVEYYFQHPIWLDGSYSRAWSSFHSSSGSALPAAADSFFLGYHQRIRRVTVNGGYGSGLQLFTIPAADRLGQLRANTFVAGLDVPTSKTWTSHFTYTLERRSNGTLDQVLTAGMVFTGHSVR